MAHHGPRIGATDSHARNAAVARRFHAVFICFAGKVRSRVVCLAHVRAEHVLGKIVVRRADIGVAKLFAHQHEREVVVAADILLVHANLHAERVFQVEERLLHVVNHHGNVGDARLFQLANLALNEHFTLHAQNAFRAFVQ